MINPKNLKKSILDYAIRGELSAKYRRENQAAVASNTISGSLNDENHHPNCHCETCQKASRGNLPTTENQANDYNDKEIATTATQSRNDGVLTAFDEIAAYNAKITQIKGQRETLLLQIEKQHKSEKNAHRKARLKTLSGSLKAKIKSYRTITPLNQNAEFTPPFEIPNSWAWVKLGDLGEFKKGPFGSALTKSMFVPKSANSVKVYEQKNAIQKNEKLGDYFITKEYFESSMQGFIVKGGDIIVSCAGTIGEIYKLPSNSETGIINQALMRIRLNRLSIYDYFKVIFDFAINENSDASKGTAIKNIPPFEILKNLPIPLPPLAEQRFIAEELEKALCECDKYESSVNALLNLEDGLFNKISKSVLDYAIHGELSAQYRRKNQTAVASNTISGSLNDENHHPNCHCETCQKASRGNLLATESQANDYNDKGIASTATQSRNDGVLTAFDEITAYNAKTAKIKEQREKLLAKIDKQLKAEKGTKRKTNTRHSERSEESLNLNETRDSSPTAQNDGNVSGNLKTPEQRTEQLKRISGSLKNKIKTYRTITPLNQNPEFTPPFDIPKEWAWVKLGEICEIVRGGSFQKKDFQDFGVPCIHYGQIHAKYSFFVEKTLSFISKEVALQNNKFAFKNNIILAITSENLDDVGKAVAYFGDEKCAIGGHTAILRHKQYAKYLLYYFYSDIFTQQKSKVAHGSKVIELSSVKLNDFIIPLPPLAEQQFIAGQLEKLLDLCKKLKTKP